MRDFGAAIGLVFAIEGLLLAGFTDTMRKPHGGGRAARPQAPALVRPRGGGVRRAHRLGGARFGGLGGAWSRFGHDWQPQFAIFVESDSDRIREEDELECALTPSRPCVRVDDGLASAIALALVAPPLAPAVAQSRPTNLADLVDSVAEAVVNISATQTVEEKPAEGVPDLPKGTPVRRHVRAVLQEPRLQRRAAASAQVLLARLRLRDRSQRHRDHQQSRRRRRQRHRRDLHRRAQAEGQGDRQGSQGRRRRAEGRERQAAEDRQVRRQRQGARRRRRDGGRQSVRPRRDGDRRHPVGAQPQHRERSLRRLPADRRLDQQGQFGRPAVQPAGRSDRHQHRDPFALGRLDRHRFRDAFGHGAAGHRATGEIRRDASRLARRAHSAGRRRHCGEPAARDRARRARGGDRRERPGQARRLAWRAT